MTCTVLRRVCTHRNESIVSVRRVCLLTCPVDEVPLLYPYAVMGDEDLNSTYTVKLEFGGNASQPPQHIRVLNIPLNPFSTRRVQ